MGSVTALQEAWAGRWERDGTVGPGTGAPARALPQPVHTAFSSWAQGCLPMSLCQTLYWLCPLVAWQPKPQGASSVPSWDLQERVNKDSSST